MYADHRAGPSLAHASHSSPLFSPCMEALPVLIEKPHVSWKLFCSPLGPQFVHPLTHSFIHLPFSSCLILSCSYPTYFESWLMCLLGLFQKKPSFLFFALTDTALDHRSFRLLAPTSPLIQASAKMYPLLLTNLLAT